jgi:hypothetical protein
MPWQAGCSFPAPTELALEEVTMPVIDDVKELLMQYATGGAPAGDIATHFQQVAQSVDSAALTQGIAAALRSDKTPPFSELVSQLFTSGSSEQKSAMLKTLVSVIPPERRQQISTVIPELGSVLPVSGDVISTKVAPDSVQKLAQHAEKQDASIVEKMSAVYAAHPALVRTLGATAMTIAMRAIAERRHKV